jgi:ATP/maltotriose-dependent transcriptional regulator MalT
MAGALTDQVGLVERDRDLARVRELLAAAAAGQGATALVEGPPGIGKTVLLAVTGELAGSFGMRVVSAIGGELEQDMPFAIVRQLFESSLRGVPDLLTGAAGLAAPVFRQSTQDTEPALGDVVHGLYWLCANLAEDRPLLLVVDDVHWADDPSLRFLSHLSRRIADLPALLLIAGRPGPMLDRLVDGVLGSARPESIRLAPLSDDGVGVLVRRDLSAEAEVEFCRACAAATGGNPFLLAEALTRLRADGTRPVAAEAHRVENLRPETITRAVLARIARHGPAAIKFARSLAVLGPTAQPRHVAALAGLTVDETGVLADALARDTIVTNDRPIGYVHPLVRTAVYADSTALLRAIQHKQAARILADDGVPAEQYAPHLLAADPAGDPWVVDALRTAANTALGRGAPEPAAAYLARARAEPPVAKAEVTALWGRTLGMAGQLTQAATALAEAIELAQDPVERIQLALDLAYVRMRAGRAAEAAEAAGLARQLVAELDVELPPQMHARLAMSDLIALQPAEVWVSRLDRVLRDLSGAGEVDRVIQSMVAFGRLGTVDRHADEIADMARRAATGPIPRQDTWLFLNMASAALGVADRHVEALDLLDRGMDVVRSLGDEGGFRYLAMLRSHSAWFAGRLLEAEADARSALQHVPGDPRGMDDPLGAAMLVDALVDRGELAEAEQVLVDYDIAVGHRADTLIMHFVPMARGRLRLARNNFTAALADFRSAGRILLNAGFVNPSFAEWRVGAVRALVVLGQRAEAATLAAENLELARAFGGRTALSLALRAVGSVEGGERELALLAEAAELLVDTESELEHAHCLVAYGGALRRAGQRTQALEPLRQGLDLANRCGAVPLAARAMEELRAAGARPRRAAVTGRDALTASELRVARLAVDGLTNREIAQTLFLSTRTVEVHLTNTYRKLGIDARRKLADAIA